MDLGLQGKTAFVTGGSSGIGAATACALAAEGADVVVGYGRNREGAEQSAQSVRAVGCRAWVVQMDVADAASVSAGMQHVQAVVDGLDVLVLCAGHNVVTPLDAIGPDEWRRVVDVNLSGAFYVLQAALPLLRDGSGVVAVSSVAAHTGAPHHAHYAAAKAGLINLVKSAARALAPRIRVNCVAPGITRTPMGEETLENLEEGYAERKLLAQRFAAPEEIAHSIVFLASPVARFVYGATLNVNGGRDLR